MNPHDRIPLDEDRALSDALRRELRAQRRDVAPPADLWPGIAARLDAQPTPASRQRPWFALAASVALAVTASSLVPPARTDIDSVARVEAQRLSREYDAALQHMPDAAVSEAMAPALAVLDRSARDIRRALERDPDSRLLLDQLRRTYFLRLALSQRAVVG